MRLQLLATTGEPGGVLLMLTDGIHECFDVDADQVTRQHFPK